MRLIVETLTVDHHSVRQDGPPVILEKPAKAGASKALPEVLPIAWAWRPQRDSNPRRRRERAVS